MFFSEHYADGSSALKQVYPDLMPKSKEVEFVPRIYGFKVHGQRGSKYERKESKKELTYYTLEEIKRIKNRNQHKSDKYSKDDF